MIDKFDSVMSTLKTFHELIKLQNYSKLLNEIGDLEINIAQLKSEYARVLNENLVLKERIQILEKNKEEPPLYKNGVYYSQNGDGPFCSACYDKDKKMIRLAKSPTKRLKISHICNVCQGMYNLS